MTNKIKYFLIIFMLIFLSGCSIKTSVVLNNNSAKEKIEIYDDNENYYFQEEPITTYIKNVLYDYEYDLVQEGYDSDVFTGMYTSGVNIQKDYDGICSYFKSSEVLKRLYNEISCTKRGKTIYVQTSELLVNGDTDDGYLLDNFDNISFSITTPLKIKSNNADKISKDEYTWNIAKNVDKNIKIIIKQTRKSSLNNNSIIRANSKTNIKPFIIIGTIMILVTAVIITLSVINYRKNKIDY